MVEVARPNATATNVEQHFYSVATDDKRRAVLKILKERSITQALVFVNSKLGCARLARSFERDGLRTNALHGDKSQDERLKALDAFKARRGRRAGRDRRRRARPRHRRPAGGLQLRRAVQRRGLRPPHRPHRPRRRVGPGGHAGLARRHAAGRRHREADQEEDRDRAARARRRAAAPPLPRARASRRRRDERSPRPRRRESREPRAHRRARAARRAARSSDPFFDKPYEPPARRRPSRPGSASAPRRRRAASRRTSSRSARSLRCSAPSSPRKSRPDVRTRSRSARPSSENTAGTSAGSAPARCASRRRVAAGQAAGRVRPQLTESRVVGCRLLDAAPPSSAALRYGVSIINWVCASRRDSASSSRMRAARAAGSIGR